MHILYIVAVVMLAVVMSDALEAKNPKLEPSYAWKISEPLGLHYLSTIDTLQTNYYQNFVPWLVSHAYATTGNYGAPGQDQIFMNRAATSQFFFEDAVAHWLPSLSKQRYYNTRIPMTLLSYATGGGRDATQDRLQAEFSGNPTKRLQVGAAMDYLYSKGSYDYQADKNFTWRVFGSYIGDRYEAQVFFNNYNYLTKENGGITNDLYITDPAEVQGGVTKVDTKNIPVNLNNAFSKVTGHEFYMNHRYKVGYYEVEYDSIDTDSVVRKTYVPVTSFVWTMDYKTNGHNFLNKNATQDTTFFKHTYLNLGGTDETTKYWRLNNTLGIEMREGFKPWAKFSLAAFAMHEVRRFTLPDDTTSGRVGPLIKGLEPLPVSGMKQSTTENLVWVGGQIAKRHGSILTYNATARFGMLGSAVGDVEVTGDVSTRFKLLGDSVRITGYGYFKNLEAPFLMKNYVSNHFAWKNDFGKVRRFKVGGDLNVPHTFTNVAVGYETLQNYVYFGNDAVPVQHEGAVHVFSATLTQNFRFKALNWENKVTYQTSSHKEVVSLPQLALFTNLYFNFAIAKVLKVQLGVDCNYYTRYNAPAYNPATMTFYTQQDTKCGNFAVCDVYANFKFKKARFFLMMPHFNQGLFGGKEYFTMAHYPINPRRFQLGVSVDFAN